MQQHADPGCALLRIDKPACLGKELSKLKIIFPLTRSSRVPVKRPDSLSQTDEATGVQIDYSAALQQAIHLLRHVDLEQDYASAWDEWESSGDQALWEATAADGLTDAAR